MKVLRYLLGMAALVGSTAIASAQELRTSYFHETSQFRNQMNPAFLDSTSHHVAVFLGNINVASTGNFGARHFIYDIDPARNRGYDLGTFMHPDVTPDQFLGKLDGKDFRGDVYLNYNLFSVGFGAFGGHNLVELNMRSESHFDMPYELFEFMKTPNAREQFVIKDLGSRSNNYAEVALGHSHKIMPGLTVGAKLKLLIGLGYADLSVNRLDVKLAQDAWTVSGEGQVRAKLGNATFEHRINDLGEVVYNPTTGKPVINGLDTEDFKYEIGGFGVALDLGAVYQTPVEGLTVSAALTDLGFVSYGNTLAGRSNGTWQFQGFKNIYVASDPGEDDANKLNKQFERIGDELTEMLGLYDEGTQSVTRSLAATFNAGAEYKLPQYDKLRFGFLYTARLFGQYSWHQAMLSANVRPVKCFEATLSAGASSTGISAGAMISFYTKGFNIYLAADRFMGKLGKQFVPLNSLNTSVNLGICFPIG